MATLQKVLGAFYTDLPIAHFIVKWAVRSPTDSVLDPSCGAGVFLLSAFERLQSMASADPKVCGIDIDEEAVRTTKSRVPAARLIQSDFFSVRPGETLSFDVVVGNPPFIRYQSFNGGVRSSALARAMEAGVNLPQLSSSWAPFLVHVVNFLKPGGRLGMVVPSELGHAQYARKVLEFLIRKFRRIGVCLFRKKLFPSLSEDTGVLLCEGFGSPCSWFSVTVHEDINEVETRNPENFPVDIKAIRDGRVRLVHCLLSSRARQLYDYLSGQKAVMRLGVAADVGIGYVTGCNGYFHLSEDLYLRSVDITRCCLHLGVETPLLTRGCGTKRSACLYIGAQNPVLRYGRTIHPRKARCTLPTSSAACTTFMICASDILTPTGPTSASSGG